MTKKFRLRVGISTCLLGEKVRYDGKHKRADDIINAFAPYVDWVSLCPEVGSGMSIPRETIRLVGDKHSQQLITSYTCINHTKAMNDWIENQIQLLEKEHLSAYILKSGSPSCGLSQIKIYDEHAKVVDRGQGLFAQALTKRWPQLPVAEEIELQSPEKRGIFLQRMRSYSRKF